MTVYHIGRRSRGSISRVLRTQDTTGEFIKDQFKFINDPKRFSFAKFLRELLLEQSLYGHLTKYIIFFSDF